LATYGKITSGGRGRTCTGGKASALKRHGMSRAFELNT
jgi:hypothetical protein